MAMTAEHVVIVGGGPAALATARSYRDHGGIGGVTLVSEEPHLPYRRPPLTKELLRGLIDTAELPLEDERWYSERRVRTLLSRRVTAIDPARGTVSLEGSGDPLAADAIVLATGSRPVRPQTPGMEDPRVLTVRSLEDSLELRSLARPGARIVVIGTGFIGCEIAASLALDGAQVTLVGEDEVPQEQRLGRAVGERITAWLEGYGVTIRGGSPVTAIDGGRAVELGDGSRIAGEHVVLAIGASPRAELARCAGLPVEGDAVVVDAAMRVALAQGRVSVFAVGDVAHALNAAARRHLTVEHWGDALAHGGVAGASLAGVECCWEEVPGFWSKLGERTIKYAAWGDGYDRSSLREHESGAFTAWYSRNGAAVGVLTYECDEDYERGRELIRRGSPTP